MDSIATLILRQFEAIELSLIESSEFQFVVDGAELVCNGCPGQKTFLQVTSQNKFYMKNKLVATKKDKEPIRNIVPFPSCTFIGECELMIEGEWENYSTNTFSGKKECLTTDSFAICKNGGIIRIEHSGQYLSSEQIAKDSEELFKIAGETGTSETKKKEMGEYLSKKYGEKIVVEDFNFKRGNQVPTLDIVIRGQAKNNIYMSEQNKNILHDIENYNKNGVFFHERNKVYEYEQIQSNSVYRGVRDIDFPIKGNVYENSADYYRKRNISQSELNKTKENWNNKRIEREEREHKVLNDIKRVKNITVFDKKFDSFWLNELDVELVGSKKDKNGNTILIVNDYGNNLNKIKNQNLIKRYGKNGIKFEKSFVGRQASTLTSLYEYERLKYNYPNEYTDFFTTATFHYTLEKAKEAIIASAYINNFPTEGKNLSNSKEGYVSNDKKSSESKMNNKEFEKINKEVLETVETNKKRNINVELHKKINERGEGYYYKLYRKKNGYTGTVWDKIKATTNKKVFYTESIPNSFEVEVNGQKMWVHPNGAKHIGDPVKKYMNLSPEIKGTINSRITLAPQQRMLREQHCLENFVNKLEKYTKNGIKFGKIKDFEGWEFEISQRPYDKYPVVNHAREK
jgi:hypothetical protein